MEYISPDFKFEQFDFLSNLTKSENELPGRPITPVN